MNPKLHLIPSRSMFLGDAKCACALFPDQSVSGVEQTRSGAGAVWTKRRYIALKCDLKDT